MSSNYQQKKMMNALGAIDTKGNIVLEQFQDGTALLFQPGNAQPFCVATDYDRATASWSYGIEDDRAADDRNSISDQDIDSRL